MTRVLTLLLFALPIAACQFGTKNTDTMMDEIDIGGLQAAMASGELTSVDITQHYLDRIALLDSQLHSILELNPDALSIAAALDAEREAGKIRSPLHGVPVLLKDNIDTADLMKTTAGSVALLEAPTPKEDAFLVQRLREAGAVILGKTNLSEWANFRSTSASSGWSARGGQTRNPYNLELTPCGSSSGSAVAIAANLSTVAIGTETDGSILCPSSHNSLVGLKPTLGLISRSGIIPIAHSQDTAGPITRTVTDAALLLNALVAEDPADGITTNMRTRTPLDYTSYLQADALKGKRIGVLRQVFGRDSELDALMEVQLALLRDGGAETLDIEINASSRFGEAETQVLLHEFKNDLNNYLYERGGPYQTLEALIEFNNEHADVEMPNFGQELFLQAQASGGLGESEYISALGFSKAFSQTSINSLLDELDLDALMAPTNSVGWPVDPTGDKSGNYVSSSSLAAVSGYPSITVPAGFIDGFPIGISFMGGEFAEPQLIAIAYAFEQKTKARRAPVLD